MVKAHANFEPYLHAMQVWLGSLNLDLQQDIHLILDTPWGYAIEHPVLQYHHKTILLTDNPTTEYWEDLFSFNPTVLIAGPSNSDMILQAIILADKHQGPIKLTPPYQPKLTAKERLIMRLVALGKENKEITKLLGCAASTLENHLSNIYEKLDIYNRTQLAFYYWGMKQDYLTRIEPGILKHRQATRLPREFTQKP